MFPKPPDPELPADPESRLNKVGYTSGHAFAVSLVVFSFR